MNNDKKELVKIVAGALGSLLGSAAVSAKLGPKVHETYGPLAAGGGIFAAVIQLSASGFYKKDPALSIGLIAGTGINAGMQLLKMDAVKSKLPDSMQSMLSGLNPDYIPVVNLAGISDEVLYGDNRVRQLAQSLANQEMAETMASMAGFAETAREQQYLPYTTQGEYELDGEYELNGDEYEMNGDYELNGEYDL